jgi:hypothetical protein
MEEAERLDTLGRDGPQQLGIAALLADRLVRAASSSPPHIRTIAEAAEFGSPTESAPPA